MDLGWSEANRIEASADSRASPSIGPTRPAALKRFRRRFAPLLSAAPPVIDRSPSAPGALSAAENNRNLKKLSLQAQRPSENPSPAFEGWPAPRCECTPVAPASFGGAAMRWPADARDHSGEPDLFQTVTVSDWAGYEDAGVGT